MFAPLAAYGGPRGLCRFVDSAHAHGIAVLLDVVYNHLGPDGNYFGALSSHYMSRRQRALWGAALDFDGEGNRAVREVCLSNVEMWIRDYHIDGLRLDATDAIHDEHVPHILQEIGERARAVAGKPDVSILAEDDRNDARIVAPVNQRGLALDGVWAGDFHHALRRALTGDHEGYFADFSGSASDVAVALDRGWVFEGRPSLRTSGKPRGTKADTVHPTQIVHFIQNHDQIGNRALGNRLGSAVSPAVYRAVSALFLLSPYTPLLFMGQEWNATTPFQFFTDHHPVLGKSVSWGRRREYAAFASFAEDELPDPQDPATFLRSKLAFGDREAATNAPTLLLYRELLALRRSHPALRHRDRGSFSAQAIGDAAVLVVRRGNDGSRLTVVCNWGDALEFAVDVGETVSLTTEDVRFGGLVTKPRAASSGRQVVDAGAPHGRAHVVSIASPCSPLRTTEPRRVLGLSRVQARRRVARHGVSDAWTNGLSGFDR